MSAWMQNRKFADGYVCVDNNLVCPYACMDVLGNAMVDAFSARSLFKSPHRIDISFAVWESVLARKSSVDLSVRLAILDFFVGCLFLSKQQTTADGSFYSKEADDAARG